MADKVPASRLITEGFYLLSFGFVAMYLLRTSDSYLAFDAGMRAGSVLEELKRFEIDPSQVKNVLLTHSDMDHVGGLTALPEAKIYLPELEQPMVARKIPRFFGLMHNKPLAREYEVLSDGRELRIEGSSIRCLSTPGHTPGSMSFVVNDSILIVGDELNLNHGKAVLDRRMINMDNSQRRKSIMQLARLKGISLLCTMHSGYTDRFGEAMAAWTI